MDKIYVKINRQKLQIKDCFSFVVDANCGGIASFIGTVRNNTKSKEVTKLEFTAYKPMAIKELEKIANEAIKKFDVHKVAIHHAVGTLKVGEIAVIIYVSSAHRKAAFKACQYAIDTLKKTVPIWKKEFFTDGAIWVNTYP